MAGTFRVAERPLQQGGAVMRYRFNLLSGFFIVAAAFHFVVAIIAAATADNPAVLIASGGVFLGAIGLGLMGWQFGRIPNVTVKELSPEQLVKQLEGSKSPTRSRPLADQNGSD